MDTNVIKQVAALAGLSYPNLKERWKTLYGTEAPPYNRTYLIKRLAYRIQELAYGGLAEETREHLKQIAEAHDGATVRRRDSAQATALPGTVFVREWDGQRHEVIVQRDGFEYQGRPYRSLSAIARKITGTQWNGPAFFGLRRAKAS
jgi:hypothetical protein